MTTETSIVSRDDDSGPAFGMTRMLGMLRHDPFAFASAIFLAIIVVFALIGPMLLMEPATRVDLRSRTLPPLSFDHGWLFLLGSDTLGRSILARIIVASQNTMLISGLAVAVSLVGGTLLGLLAGLEEGWLSATIMRIGDVILSFPTMLLAIIVLYILDPNPLNVVIVLAITRVPVYMRTVRGEVLEARERVFVTAARSMGASRWRIISRHLLPVTIPTIVTLTTLQFSGMLLAESSLSFIGLGVQQPEMSWGLLVSQGRSYLVTAWWLTFWPGLFIMLTAVALTLIANWLRVVVDPQQRWRLETSMKAVEKAK